MPRPTAARLRRTFVTIESLEDRNLMAGIQLSVLSSYSTGAVTAGVSEISAYDPATQKVFSTNASQNSLGVLDISNPAAPVAQTAISLAAYGAGPNSVAVKNGIVAVAVEASPKSAPGKVVFFDTAGNYLNEVTVGALPDMLTFTPDGSKIVVCNEGEPVSYLVAGGDAEGSVSIIDISGGVANATVATASFTSFNGQEAALRAQGIRIFGPNATAAQDFEPEYATISPDGATAYVGLQENNALAVIDIATATVTSLIPSGYKNHNLPGNELDASDRDTPGSSNNGLINIRNWPVFGVYMPDAISNFTIGGETYLIMANEGDTRADWPGLNEEVRVGSMTLDAAAFAAQGYADVGTGAAGLRNNDNLGRLTALNTLGNTDGDAEFEQIYIPGGRSFSIRRLDGSLVYDSGDDFEQITAAAYPANFNANNDTNDFDSRSDNKGPEPEAITVATLGERTYAFIGLERIGGVMVYDITNPVSPTFVQYLNNRNFGVAANDVAVGDLGVEDLKFISAADSPSGTPLIVAANELSGTITLFAINVTPEITSLEAPALGAVAAGQQVTITGAFTDDTLPAAHTVEITWGDGSTSQAVVDENTFTFSATHTYTQGGAYSIGAALSDGTFNDTAATSVQIAGWRLAAGVLQIVGTPGNDVLTVSRSGSQLRLVSNFLSPRNQTIPSASVSSLNISMGDGRDLVNIVATVTQPVTIDGGDGNDLLNAGGGRSVLLGGAGNDLLSAGQGSAVLVGGEDNDLLFGGGQRDVLIGGGGSDILNGGGNEDILIGGTTSYDSDLAALSAIQATWTGPGTKAARQSALQSGATPLIYGDSISDDDSIDLLLGGAGSDWLFSDAGDLGID